MYVRACRYVCVRVRVCVCASEGIEDALPLGVLSSQERASLLTCLLPLGGFEGRLGRLSRPVPIHAQNYLPQCELRESLITWFFYVLATHRERVETFAVRVDKYCTEYGIYGRGFYQKHRVYTFFLAGKFQSYVVYIYGCICTANPIHITYTVMSDVVK